MIKKIKKLKKIRLHREGTDTLVYGFIVIAAIALLLWRFIDSKVPFWCFTAVMGTSTASSSTSSAALSASSPKKTQRDSW